MREPDAPTSPFEYDAFLCHTAADKPAVRSFAEGLRAAGLTVWLDEDEVLPGDSIIGSIEEGLTKSSFVFVCLSSNFAASKWGKKELRAASYQQIDGGPTRVVPVLVGDCPKEDIPLFLADLNREDVRTAQGRDRVVHLLKGKRDAAPVSTRKPRGTVTEYRVVLEKRDSGVEATWQIPGGKTFPRLTLTSPLTREDVAEHRWYLEEYLRWAGVGDHVRARAFEKKLEEVGRALYDQLTPPRGSDVLAELMRVKGPKQLTLCSDDAEALSLPWELLRDHRSPLVFNNLVLRRQLMNPHGVEEREAMFLPLRILLVVSRPTDVAFIDPRSSVGPMLDALDTLGGLVHVDLCTPPTLSELNRRLEKADRKGKAYHLVHFDGHGVYMPVTGVGALCFENDEGENDLIEGTRLGDLLARARIPVALLEACQTADLSGVVFGSVAPALLKSGVGSVLAFSHSVYVSAARILVQHFYEALCAGDTVGEALNAARRALEAKPLRHTTQQGEKLNLRDWHIAELYQAGDDPILVPGGTPKSIAESEPLHRGKAPSGDFVPAPMYGFQGRAREMLDVQRKLEKHTALLLTGMGGMGKTSIARESAFWWHRIGMRPGGAEFFSFESRQGADLAILSFGKYLLEGDDRDNFERSAPEERWKTAVRLFRTRPVLWVWDNFESTLPVFQQGQADTLAFPDDERVKLAKLCGELTDKTAGKPQGWLLVTCRPGETFLPAVASMDLQGLSIPDALALTRKILERKNVKIGAKGYEREEVEKLLAVLGNHPLSIELVVPHLVGMKPAEAAKGLREKLDLFANDKAEEGRNRGLRASLSFSTGRLSEATQKVLPYLAWFEGGAFEALILAFTQLDPELWASVRSELLATALVRVEDGLRVSDRPYLRFHPTLSFAGRPDEVVEQVAVGERFVAVYWGLMGIVDRALYGSNPGDGMAVMLREEANMHLAMERAFARGEFERGAGLAETIGSYLQSAARAKDQARLAAWVQERMAQAPTGPPVWATQRQHAWGLFLSGRGQEAIDLLQKQLGEIEAAGGDPRQRGLCLWYLGRILVEAGQPRLALGPLAQAIKNLESARDDANLSAALGDQANALRAEGRLSEALSSAERAAAIGRKLGNKRNEAADLVRVAQILKDQHRFADAELRYRDALKTAQEAGDAELEGTTFQHLGSLYSDQGRHAEAVPQYKEALARFQAVGDQAGEMRTANLLGTAEENLNHYPAARAWFTRARELAKALGDERQLGSVAQNLGVLFQSEALALPEGGPERERLLREAVASVEESLAIDRKRGDEVGSAASLCQLGVLYYRLRALDKAERNVREGLAIHERLDLPDVYKDYANLERIAEARGDTTAAAEWGAKKEVKMAQLERLARGDGPPRLPPGLRDPLIQLSQAIYAVRVSQQPPPANIREVLANLTGQPDPLGAIGRFLDTVASGGSTPAIPDNLPEEIAAILAALAKAVDALAGG